MNPSPDFWHDRRVLLTGHTGFKGAWLAFWLHRLGAKVTGMSLPAQTTPNLYTLADIGAITDSHFVDVRDAGAVAAVVKQARPEIVFHLAAQALVHTGYREPLETFATNVLGTANLLDSLRPLDSVRIVVAITTDKVYQNMEHPYPYRETDALGGHDPYSASKAAAEIVIASYRDAYLRVKGVAIASARAGNVIGGGDWSANRLIPDAIRAWSAGRPLDIRRPQAIRPWQHVLEPLAGYLSLAQQLWNRPELAGAYNFGPPTHEATTVHSVVQLAQQEYGKGQILWGDGSTGPHEAGWLALEVAKSRTLLGISSRWSLAESVQHTIQWYRQQHQGVPALELCEADLASYEASKVTG